MGPHLLGLAEPVTVKINIVNPWRACAASVIYVCVSVCLLAHFLQSHATSQLKRDTHHYTGFLNYIGDFMLTPG